MFTRGDSQSTSVVQYDLPGDIRTVRGTGPGQRSLAEPRATCNHALFPVPYS